MIAQVSSQKRPFVLHTRVVTGQGGGPEKTILNSPRFLTEHGVDAACLFMRPPGDSGFATLQQKAMAASAEIIGVDDRGPLDWRVIRDCVRICRERGVDVWHAHDYKSNALGLLVRRFHRMHLVTTTHGWVRFTSRTPLYYAVDRFCLQRYDRVICVSQDLYDSCAALRIPVDRLSLIDNAIVVDDYDPSPPTIEERHRFGFTGDEILLGAVGRLSEEKGFGNLIKVVRRLTENEHHVGLLIAGEGHLRETLENQIREAGLGHRVRLTGFLQDPRELYRAIDLFVLSSLREGLPNVVLEAMASGRAVVTTDVNGIPRLVRDSENGIICPADDVDGLYDGVLLAVSNEHLRRSLARSGRMTVEREFSFRRRMETVCEVYRTLSDDPVMARHGAECSPKCVSAAGAASPDLERRHGNAVIPTPASGCVHPGLK